MSRYAALSRYGQAPEPGSLGRPGGMLAAPAGLIWGRPAWAGSRASRILSIALIVVGLALLAEVAVTMLWQEPFSALYARDQQHQLAGRLQKVEQAPPTPQVRHVLTHLPSVAQRVSFLARHFEAHTRRGSPVGVIHIPSIGASFVVLKGTGTTELERGPGVYSSTRFPGIRGTTAIAGHRTTWLAPFRKINALHRGDVIYLDMPYAHFSYRVTGHRVVLPTDVRAAIRHVNHQRLVLSACTPLFSAEKRLLVYARLHRIVPEGAARRSRARRALARAVPPVPEA